MNIRIGTAPDSWGVWFAQDDRQTPATRFLDEVVEAGYEWIELGPYGYLPVDAKVLERELQLRGLKVSGTFVMAHIEQKDTFARMRGIVDFLALSELRKLESFDGGATVEQDMFPAPFDKPLPMARTTRAYLQEIGLG